SFGRMVVKASFFGIMKATIFVIILLWMDELVFKIGNVPKVDKNIFVSFVIGGISIAGVILGLYCANIASIYSSRYANAPRSIAIAFQYDRLTRRCISAIVDYIIFGFLVTFATMLEFRIGWVMITIFIFWSIVVIVSYSIAGNRAYQLSDVYGVAADSNRILYRIISKRLNQKLFSTDANFQNHFQKVAERQIRLLKSIQKYGENINKSENLDNSAMTEFMLNNLVTVKLYWMIKKNLSRSSLWFRDKPRYPKWHFSSSTESSIALRTGTPLKTKGKHNLWWFEEELISINKQCLNNLFEQFDYVSIYTYITAFEKMCSTAIECKEANFYIAHVDWIKQELEKRMIPADVDGNERNAFAGVIEIVSLLYLDIILESSRAYHDFDLEKIVLKVIKAIDSGDDAEKNEYICSRQDIDFYKKIITEVKVEGKRITPRWIIKQQIAKEEYVYLNSLLDIVREGMEHAFTLGKTLSEKKLYFEACIILTRFYEYESEFARFINIVKSRKEELESFQIDKALKWDEFRLDKLQNTISEWKKYVPALFFECSSHFALDNWENREEYPDFLGECYNRICEDAVEAITSGDIKQFEIDFENLSKLMILYQEYIRSDLIKNKDLYRVEYVYYMFTSPIVEWAQIGGLAILWGEFHSNDEWKICVCKSSDLVFKKDGELTGLAEKLI
ncbi:type II restriction endonuclease subunit M, partial [Mordavella massiliensis]|nr:type II restriction endonuclease subunit M [Mordavella massiliensis]